MNKIPYYPSKRDAFFFDCNIWIFLFFPIVDFRIDKQERYSDFLHKAIEAESNIFVNSLVLSEFYNRFVKKNYKHWMAETGNYHADFKRDYQRTSTFQRANDEATSFLKLILKLAKIKSDDFEDLSNESIYSHLQKIDFNDSYYLEFCKRNNFILVSDDRDYQKINDSGVLVLR